MKRLGFIFLVCALAVLPASAGLIDFESGTEGNPVGTIGIVTFTDAIYAEVGSPRFAFGSSGGDDFVLPTGTTDYGTMFITDLVGDHPSNPDYDSVYDTGPITITFSAPVENVSFQLLDIESASEAFSAIANTGETITTGIGGGDGIATLVQFSTTGITSIVVDVWPTTGNGLTGWALDNLSFTEVPTVPVPGALLLGLLGVGLVRTKIRKPLA